MINAEASYQAIGRQVGEAQFRKFGGEAVRLSGKFKAMLDCEGPEGKVEAERIYQAARQAGYSAASDRLAAIYGHHPPSGTTA